MIDCSCCCVTNQSIYDNFVELINIDFGCVSVGKIGKKTVKIINESCKKNYYQVKRDNITDPLDHNVFEIESYKWILVPGDFFEFKIKYQPIIPFRSNVDYFDITDCDSKLYKICVRGTCIGPDVVSSVSRLVMICPKEGGDIRKRLQLKNSSDVAAIFMFDIDEADDHCPLKLDLTRGTISPNNHVYVTIKFSPRNEGIYAYYLTCLIQYQEPLITEIIGYRGSKYSKNDEFNPLLFSQPKPMTTNYLGYMNDSVKISKGTYPPITISDNYIDFFNENFIDKDKIFQSLPKTLSINNHTAIDVTVQWDQDIDGIFNVKPCNVVIRGGKSAIFEFNFIPDKKDALFSKQLFAQALWKNDITNYDGSVVPVPLVLSVRMIGQSFSAGSVGWIPQYEIPSTVVLPPSIPSEPIYANFIIKLRGHLPITFRFLPSTNINRFIVKPMVGIIRRDYQIVTVQLFPDDKLAECESPYTELWTIRFNGNSRYEDKIFFKASVQYPKIIIGHDFNVRFKPVHPMCEQNTRIIMRNRTRHCIEYLFPDLPSEINLTNKKGIILANEILSNDIKFFSKEIGDHLYNVNCCVTALKDGRSKFNIGNSFDVPFSINGKVEPGYLVALPDQLNFGTISYGGKKSLSFKLFNFSSVNLSYKLICKESDSYLPIGNYHVERDVVIRPESETVSPGSNIEINVDLTPKKSGFYQLILQYLLRSNPIANETLRDSIEPRNICCVNCMCILPDFEVKDLLYVNNRELKMSKAMLWNLLDIDKFNATAKSVLPGERRDVYFRFPESITSPQSSLLIKLLIVNSTSESSSWSLKRVKKCDCKLVMKNRGFNFTYKEYNCDHRLACTISPRKGTIQPHGRVIVDIKICYVISGKTNLKWELKLSDDRVILINADVVTLSSTEARPSLLIHPVLSMEKIYLGDLDAANQIYWMYNSTDKEVNYSFDIRSLEQINIDNFSEIFRCHNPSGFIPRHSHYPVIFKFQPRRFETYKVNLPLKLGDLSTNLSINAEADIICKKRYYLPISKAPNIDEFSINELPVSFSNDQIIVSSMPLHSKVNRIVTIFNDSKNEVFGYRWESYEVPGVIEVKAIPSSGRIQPSKAHTFCIEINSRSHTCKITNIHLSCRFVDLSAQRTYEKIMIARKTLSEEFAGQFLITEKGIEELKTKKIPSKLIDKPKPFYKSLAISCYVYSSIDKDLKTTIDEQLKSFPPSEIRIKNNEIIRAEIPEKFINKASFVLEGMIWDILNSNDFMNTLKDNIAKLQNVKYGRYKINPIERQRLVARSYSVASRQLIESIFEQMIFGIIHEEFGLSMYHFDGPQDIRQYHYQKRDPKLPKRNNIYDKTNFKEMKLNRTKSEVKGGINSTEFNIDSQVKFNVKYDDSSNDSSYD